MTEAVFCRECGELLATDEPGPATAGTWSPEGLEQTLGEAHEAGLCWSCYVNNDDDTGGRFPRMPPHPAILAMWRHRGGERDGWLRFIFRRDATPEEIAEAVRELSESGPDDD